MKIIQHSETIGLTNDGEGLGRKHPCITIFLTLSNSFNYKRLSILWMEHPLHSRPIVVVNRAIPVGVRAPDVGLLVVGLDPPRITTIWTNFGSSVRSQSRLLSYHFTNPHKVSGITNRPSRHNLDNIFPRGQILSQRILILAGASHLVPAALVPTDQIISNLISYPEICTIPCIL